MDETTRHQWAERAVRMVAHNFPDADEVTNWPRCKIYLPHAISCAEHIEQENMTFFEAIDV